MKLIPLPIRFPRSIQRQVQFDTDVEHVEVFERDIDPAILAKVGRMKQYWAVQLQRIYIKKKHS